MPGRSTGQALPSVTAWPAWADTASIKRRVSHTVAAGRGACARRSAIQAAEGSGAACQTSRKVRIR